VLVWYLTQFPWRVLSCDLLPVWIFLDGPVTHGSPCLVWTLWDWWIPSWS